MSNQTTGNNQPSDLFLFKSLVENKNQKTKKQFKKAFGFDLEELK